MKILNNFRFKAWHFILMFALLIIATNVIDAAKSNIPVSNIETRFVELDGNSMKGSEQTGISFVLCYKKDSDLCDKMEYNLNQLSYDIDFKFFKLDIEKYPQISDEHRILGVPSILILNDGKEIERVLGVVPVSNLEIISKRIIGNYRK